MKLFETVYGDKTFGYRVDQNGVLAITKRGNVVRIDIDHPEAGKIQSMFDLTQLPVYTIG